MPDLPDEIDATENPLSIESTKLVGAYTADFHHHEHAPKPEYSVDAVAQELAEAKPRRATAVGSGWQRPAPTTAMWSATASTTPAPARAPQP